MGDAIVRSCFQGMAEENLAVLPETNLNPGERQAGGQDNHASER